MDDHVRASFFRTGVSNFMTISTEKMEECLAYMAKTDVQHAMLRALVDDYEYRIKMAEARVARESKDKGTQDYIKSLTRTDPEYIKLVDELYETNMNYQIISAKRKTAELIIEVWRSLNANSRRGNII